MTRTKSIDDMRMNDQDSHSQKTKSLSLELKLRIWPRGGTTVPDRRGCRAAQFRVHCPFGSRMGMDESALPGQLASSGGDRGGYRGYRSGQLEGVRDGDIAGRVHGTRTGSLGSHIICGDFATISSVHVTDRTPHVGGRSRRKD